MPPGVAHARLSLRFPWFLGLGRSGVCFSRKSVRTQGFLLVGLRSFAPRPYHAPQGGRYCRHSFPLDEYSAFTANEPPDSTDTMVSAQAGAQARREQGFLRARRIRVAPGSVGGGFSCSRLEELCS